MTPKEWPYFIDNGAYTDSFDPDEWTNLLDKVIERMPHRPDFVVLPDAYNDANGTLEMHRRYINEVLDRGMPPAPVLQPGMDAATQVRLYANLGADVLFVGGDNRWKKAYGAEIVDIAHSEDLKVHVGNPGGQGGLLWWAKAGADSVDTTTIIQNQYWHWLEALEEATSLKGGSLKKDTALQEGLGGFADV